MNLDADAALPTENQKKKLCRMLHTALVEIRGLTFAGKARQAYDLADAFHNLPTGMWHNDFSLNFFEHSLERYQQNYPDARDYLKMLDEVRKLRG